MPFPSLARYLATLPDTGVFSVWVGPVAGAPWFAFQEDVEHYAASTMKVALVMAAFREAEAGRIDLDAPIKVHNCFASALDDEPYSIDSEDDSDPEPWRRLGTPVALRWLAHRALVRSSNLATNLVLESVGVAAVAALLDCVGTAHSRVTRGIEDARAGDAGLHNIVCAADLARVLQSLTGERVLSRAGSVEILSVLGAQQINDAIPARLPADVRVAHKSGWVEGVSHDAGIITPVDRDPFVFVMCTTSDLNEQVGLDVIATASLAAWEDRRVQE